MYYPIKKVWNVLIRTSNDEKIYTFKTRYHAYNLFIQLKQIIDDTFPNELIMSSNIDRLLGNAYYGCTEHNIEIWLIGNQIIHGTNNTIINAFKEDIKYEI